ncbi:MAG: mechanosensitive ion channel family protein [Thiohalocapsa sp.]|jgi:small-conductance mechanosensitive channel/CRP-like cAMP-binding protein|uniref:mechanosensitive ion channel family protein n=1 Tax=Thiohalocapsa sp. TaxID=2497641 RepID=UPI0025D8AD3B|nr:mechanosensitive ion channel family protein [Thiohalocapsa sp.]MCG6941992.1 mechanosensitive ion channel family protein [Thiohalocapsa sp.]
MQDPGITATTALLRFMDKLTSNYWQLLLAALALFLLWRIGTRVVGERPLFDHFPRITAALDVVVLPFGWIIGGSLLRAANRTIGLPPLDKPIKWITALAAYLAAGWALARLVEVQLLLRAEQRDGERVPQLVIGLLYILLMLVGLGLFMYQKGYALSGVWVSTGVAAAVLGLALQKTLGDLFSGIALGVERPFRIGDWLELADGRVGEVADMNWRATRLRGWDNTTLVIPNSSLAGQSFKNLHGDNHIYAPWYFVKVPAEVDPRYASELLLEAAMRCESVLKLPPPVVRLADASSLPYSYMVWVHIKNYPAMFRAREELFREIHKSLLSSGIEVAPQVQEIRTRRAHLSNAEPPTLALALKSLEFAGDLTDEEIEHIAAESEYRYHNTGHVLLAEGSVSDAFYVIAGGLVESAMRLPDGSRKPLETFGPGSYFGLTAMLTTEPSFEEFIAKSDVTLIRIDLECLRGVVNARPELKDKLVALLKTRLDTVESARAASRRRTRRLTMRDIRLGLERRLRHPRV